MRLCRARHAEGHYIGLRWRGQWLDLSGAMQSHPYRFPWLETRPQPEMEDLLKFASDLVSMLGELAEHLEQSGELAEYLVVDTIDALAPVSRPSKIVALGLNYLAHAEEGGFTPPKEPLFFAKAPSSVIGPGEAIVYPEGVERLDPEIELGVIIGREAHRVSEDEAMEYVAGYTVLNDVTARDMQLLDMKRSHPWFRSKSYDTFCPLGPHLVLRDDILDPHELDLTLRVNGEVRQQASTADLLFGVPQLVAYVSRYMTLLPGDVIATGTPGGIAPVLRGDVIECTISGLGTLSNPVE